MNLICQNTYYIKAAFPPPVSWMRQQIILCCLNDFSLFSHIHCRKRITCFAVFSVFHFDKTQAAPLDTNQIDLAGSAPVVTLYDVIALLHQIVCRHGFVHAANLTFVQSFSPCQKALIKVLLWIGTGPFFFNVSICAALP